MVAAMSTFIASGILHEYVLLLITLPSSTNATGPDAYIGYAPSYGNQSCFFAWNGMLMILEYIFMEWSAAARFESSAPPLVKSMLVVLMALPVSHWFTDEYVRSGLFAHYAVGFPIITQLK
jgi:hypothetical protein